MASVQTAMMYTVRKSISYNYEFSTTGRPIQETAFFACFYFLNVTRLILIYAQYNSSRKKFYNNN